MLRDSCAILSLALSVHRSVFMSLSLSVSLSLCPPVCLNVSLSVRLYDCLYLLSASPSVSPSVRLSWPSEREIHCVGEDVRSTNQSSGFTVTDGGDERRECTQSYAHTHIHAHTHTHTHTHSSTRLCAGMCVCVCVSVCGGGRLLAKSFKGFLTLYPSEKSKMDALLGSCIEY